MLKSIDIKGLAVVDQLNLELMQGMTVLTGETGAGKSILLTAMKLCLGERADANLLRPGVKKADISLDFDISQSIISQAWLKDNELDEENDCLIRRTISADGRSRAYINGQAVNLKTLQKLSQHLISIHGQHAHLDLLLPAQQCALLDSALSNPTPLSDCQQHYQHWKTLQDELLTLTDGNTDNDSEKQLLSYQINELEQTELVLVDYQQLIQQHNLASNMSKILELAEGQANTLYENDNHSIHGLLSSSAHELNTLSELSPEFSSIAEQINEAVIQVQEASRELRSIIDLQDNDPSQLDTFDRQLSQMHQIARKLQVEPQQLTDKYQQLKTRLQLLENRHERLETLQLEIEQAEHSYAASAEQLHQERLSSASELSGQISATLKTLGLPDGQLEIRVSHNNKQKPQKNGLDDVSLLVSTNPGMPTSSINKVASGGELSRISLAIQVVSSQSNTTPTLVFDEVDAGIGGGVAETVGSCLRGIAAGRQILCVTHLPQVASQGHQHLFVSKNKTSEQTKTQIETLNDKARINEVARMLGGIDISAKTLAHAEEMLNKAI